MMIDLAKLSLPQLVELYRAQAGHLSFHTDSNNALIAKLTAKLGELKASTELQNAVIELLNEWSLADNAAELATDLRIQEIVQSGPASPPTLQ